MTDICVTVMVVVFVLAMAYMVTHAGNARNETGKSFRPPQPTKNAKPPKKKEKQNDEFRSK